MEIAGTSGKDIAGFLLCRVFLCRVFGGDFLISIYARAASCHIKIVTGVNARADSRHKRAAADWATLPTLRSIVEIAGSRRVPGDRHQLSPYWPWMWIFNVHHLPLRFSYRFIGSEHMRAMELEATGRWVDEIRRRFSSLSESSG
jgi:hypothetical protein